MLVQRSDETVCVSTPHLLIKRIIYTFNTVWYVLCECNEHNTLQSCWNVLIKWLYMTDQRTWTSVIDYWDGKLLTTRYQQVDYCVIKQCDTRLNRFVVWWSVVCIIFNNCIFLIYLSTTSLIFLRAVGTAEILTDTMSTECVEVVQIDLRE